MTDRSLRCPVQINRPRLASSSGVGHVTAARRDRPFCRTQRQLTAQGRPAAAAGGLWWLLVAAAAAGHRILVNRWYGRRRRWLGPLLCAAPFLVFPGGIAVHAEWAA